MKNSKEVNKSQLDVPDTDNAVLTNNYSIPDLNREDNGTKYKCQAIINGSKSVNATDVYTIGNNFSIK